MSVLRGVATVLLLQEQEECGKQALFVKLGTALQKGSGTFKVYFNDLCQTELHLEVVSKKVSF